MFVKNILAHSYNHANSPTFSNRFPPRPPRRQQVAAMILVGMIVQCLQEENMLFISKTTTYVNRMSLSRVRSRITLQCQVSFICIKPEISYF